MARSKNPKVTSQSSWDRAKMPRYALAVSAVLVNTKGTDPHDRGAALDSLKAGILEKIKQHLYLDVDSISLILIEESKGE